MQFSLEIEKYGIELAVGTGVDWKKTSQSLSSSERKPTKRPNTDVKSSFISQTSSLEESCSASRDYIFCIFSQMWLKKIIVKK